MGTTDHDTDTGVAGSDLVEEFLEHHGVKGMKWGVRKAEKAQARADRQQKVADHRKAKWDAARAKKGQAPGTVNTRKRVTVGQREANAVNSQRIADRLQKKADKKLAKVDGKWEKQIYTVHGAVAVHNSMAEHFNSKIDALNDGPKWKDKEPLGNKELEADYMRDIDTLTSQSYAHAVRAVHGSSPSGKKEAVFVDDEQGQRIEVRNKSVKHADGEDDEPDLVLHVNIENGKIVSTNQAELGVEHSDPVDDFLAHYGVKGMKWGVRKSESGSSPVPVTATQKKPGKFVTTKGGEKHPAHEDAVKAVVARQKAKGSTTDALSNAELQAAVTRMNLEAQFKRLDQENDRRSKGKRFIAGLLGAPKTGKKEKNPMDSHEAAGVDLRNAVAEALNKKAAA